MTPAQQAAKIKDGLTEMLSNYGDWCRSLEESDREKFEACEAQFNTAIDSLAAEVDRLSGLASLADEERLEIARRAINLWDVMRNAKVKPTADDKHSAQTGSYFPTPKPEDCKATGDFTVVVKTGEVKP